MRMRHAADPNATCPILQRYSCFVAVRRMPRAVRRAPRTMRQAPSAVARRAGMPPLNRVACHVVVPPPWCHAIAQPWCAISPCCSASCRCVAMPLCRCTAAPPYPPCHTKFNTAVPSWFTVPPCRRAAMPPCNIETTIMQPPSAACSFHRCRSFALCFYTCICIIRT